MKTYELTQEQIKMIVDALDFSIDALSDIFGLNDKVDNDIMKLTTLKNYLEQY